MTKMLSAGTLGKKGGWAYIRWWAYYRASTVHTSSFEMVHVLTCHEFVSPVSLTGLGNPRTVGCEKSISPPSILTALLNVDVYP